MCPDAPYFIILLSRTPDDFTCQGESAARHSNWVKDYLLVNVDNFVRLTFKMQIKQYHFI
jgi:predicted alpha-1,6-mannanase (GH76 family)